MEAGGFINVWWKQFSSDPTRCLSMIQQEMKSSLIGSGGGTKKRLTLNGLSGAFIVLLVGYVLGICTFVVERCFYKNGIDKNRE